MEWSFGIGCWASWILFGTSLLEGGGVVVGLELFVWAGISRYISLLHFLTILFLVFLKCPFCSKSTVADVTFECLVF